jgi:hypothetical protein
VASADKQKDRRNLPRFSHWLEIEGQISPDRWLRAANSQQLYLPDWRACLQRESMQDQKKKIVKNKAKISLSYTKRLS